MGISCQIRSIFLSNDAAGVLTVLAILIKYTLYASALFLIGLSLHRVFLIENVSKKKTGLLAPVGGIFLGAVVLKLLIANAQLAGSLSGAFSGDTFKWVWRPHAIQTYLFVGALGAVAAYRVFNWRAGLVIAPAGIALGFGMAGHIQGIEAPAIWVPFVAIHVLIAGFWLVAPLTLYPAAAVPISELQQRTARFSSLAIKAVPLLFVTGVLVLWQLLEGLGQMVSTPYGRLLTFKLVAAVVLLGLGAINKFWVSEQLAQKPTSGLITLKRTLVGEAILFASVLLILTLATTITGPGHTG